MSYRTPTGRKARRRAGGQEKGAAAAAAAYLLRLVEEVSDQPVVPPERPVIHQDARLDAVVHRPHPAFEVGPAAFFLQGRVRVALVARAVDAGREVHEEREVRGADRGRVLREAGDLGRVPVAGDEPHEGVADHCDGVKCVCQRDCTLEGMGEKSVGAGRRGCW